MNTANNSEYVLDTIVHSVPDGWDMNEIVAQIVLEYGQEFEQLARLIIMHMMHDKSYGKHKEKLYKELVKIYKGKEDKYLQYNEV
jgi:hypothetical protein